MDILIFGSSLQTAVALDEQQLNQQIMLCDRIIGKLKAGAIDKEVEAYQGHLWWVQMHCNTLDYYQKGLLDEAAEMSYLAERYKPAFIQNKIKDGQ